jgi:histidyl-tRNA synthetase
MTKEAAPPDTGMLAFLSASFVEASSGVFAGGGKYLVVVRFVPSGVKMDGYGVSLSVERINV